MPKKTDDKKNKCTLKDEFFAETMAELIKRGAQTPTEVGMSDWYYLQRHAKSCKFCRSEFERLAREAKTSGPATLVA